MHMADALVSPAVGGTMWAVSAGLIGYSCKKVSLDLDEQRVPLMGVMGAFVFAAEMINFAIPGTGSSGHLGGGLLLAALLGPSAAFLTMVSVLIVQAVFFADGGLLALGCNIFNLGFLPCFVAYPLIFKKLTNKQHLTHRRIVAASTLSAVTGLQLGALAVVLQTTLSDISALPLLTFAVMMQPIHLAIGIVEGVATAAVILFVSNARPELLNMAGGRTRATGGPGRLLAVLAVSTLLIGGVVSWFASSRPDGLEWAIAAVAGTEEIGATSDLHTVSSTVQEATALLPDYDFSDTGTAPVPDAPHSVISSGTSAAGILGGGLTLILAGALAVLFRRRRRNGPEQPDAPASSGDIAA